MVREVITLPARTSRWFGLQCLADGKVLILDRNTVENNENGANDANAADTASGTVDAENLEDGENDEDDENGESENDENEESSESYSTPIADVSTMSPETSFGMFQEIDVH
jgi:hypothetical protein